MSVFSHLAGAYSATLYVIVIGGKGVGVHPPPLPARADFSIMGCAPEIGNRHSVCTLRLLLAKAPLLVQCRAMSPIYGQLSPLKEQSVKN